MVLSVLLALALGPAIAGPPTDLADVGRSPAQHVRAERQEARRLVAAGVAGSATVRRLMSSLERSDVVVYVECSQPTGDRRHARLSFLAATGGRRYLSIWLSQRSPLADQVSLFGHELQHAVEVALAPSVVSAQTLAAHFAKIGRHGHRAGTFETEAARTVGQQVRQELTEHRPTPASKPLRR